jgi:DNA-binding LytR/AlgR family response regulator
MNVVKILIVEDDLDFSELLKLLLNRLGYENIRVANNFESGKQFFESEVPDLVILDIDLGNEKSGVNLGSLFRSINKELPIIFMTNNYQEIIYEQTIPIRPDAFLSKELSSLKVRQAVELALSTATKPLNLSEPQNTRPLSRIFIKIGSHYKKVDIKIIDFFFYEHRHSNACVGENIYPLNYTMKEINNLLPQSDFIQIHQSYIINIDKIDKVSFSKSEIEIAGKTLPIGISFKNKIQKNLHFLR